MSGQSCKTTKAQLFHCFYLWQGFDVIAWNLKVPEVTPLSPQQSISDTRSQYDHGEHVSLLYRWSWEFSSSLDSLVLTREPYIAVVLADAMANKTVIEQRWF